MLEALTDKLQGVFHKLGSHGVITEKDLDEALREVRIALLEADVNFKVVRQFISDVREQAAGSEVLKSLTGPQQVISIVNQQLIHILGDSTATLTHASKPPTVMLVVGLKGSGKTTTAAKLALHLRKTGARPMLVSADPQRVAAGEQLRTLGRQLDMPVAIFDSSKHLRDVARLTLEEAQRNASSVVIVDTAGYARVSEESLAGLSQLTQELAPTETLLVVDAMTGQEAVNVAGEFHKILNVTGLIITKMDGDARGGAALSIRAVTGLPVKFIGVGEKPDALETFHPDRFASRILGMGDVISLAERAKEAMEGTDVKQFEKKMRSQGLDLEDFIDQLRRLRKMGPLSQVMEMMPGFSQMKGKINQDGLEETYLKRIEAIVMSMTPHERRNPHMIDGSRRKRIARGSGTTPQDVNRLLNQWAEARKLMQAMAKNKGRGILRAFR